MDKSFDDQAIKALDLINNSKRILIVPSSPVDGDSVGSAIALFLILKKMGKKPTINYSFDRFESFKFLPGAENIEVLDLFKVDFSKYDLVIFHDGGDLSQFYDGKVHRDEFILPENTSVLNIDHHPTNSHWAQYMVWDPSMSSVGEMLTRMFSGTIDFDKDIATNLYTAISSDTGQFRYINTTREVMEIAGSLLDYGVEMGNLLIKLYQTDSYATILFSGYLTSKIKVNDTYKYAWFTISLGEWQKAGLTLEEVKNATSRTRDSNLRSIDGTDFTFCLTEEQENYVGGSWRNRNPGLFDMSIFAQTLGGGGHKEAAGFAIHDRSLDDAEKLVHETIAKHYEAAKTKPVDKLNPFLR